MLGFLKKYEERIKNSKKRINNCFNNKYLDIIPIIFNFSPYYLVKYDKNEIKRYFSNPYSALEIHIESIKEHLEYIEDDYVPYLNPFFGVCALSSGFGGLVRFFNDKDPWLETKIINDYKDIDKLKKPDAKSAGLMKMVFNLMKVWKREVKDRISIGHTDIQGPVSICIDIMGVEKFFIGIIDDPKRIHNLLEIVTEYIIDCLKLSYNIIGERNDGYFIADVYIPKGYGKVRISEDNLVFISKEFCRKFLTPYIERIFKEINKGIIHWCGDAYENISEILRMNGITAFNNTSMGDIDIIKKQNNLSIEKGIVFENAIVLPNAEWFKKANSIIRKKNIIHQIIVPSDKFGISFEGYESISCDKLDNINRIIGINSNQ